MKNVRLNVLLGKTDYLASSFNAMIKDFGKFFQKSQGAFLGEKRTYSPKEGTVDEPGKRKNTMVQTTVVEKIAWFMDGSRDYIDSLFSVEKTNSSGNAKAELIVDGDSWGTFTSLELLRLKSVIENSDLKSMFENMPVRSDSANWTKSDNEMYVDRDVYESDLLEGVEKTTVKETYVLEDPNIGKLKDQSSYSPQLAQKHTVEELGDYTHQVFSGETSQRRKAIILKRRSSLLASIIESLKMCNEADSIKSELTSDLIFGYLFE